MGQTKIKRPFSSYKAYERAINRLDDKYERNYPVIRLPRSPKGYKKIWDKAWAEYDQEFELLKSRLPIVQDSDFPDEPVTVSPYEILIEPEHPFGTLYQKDLTTNQLDFMENDHPWSVVHRSSRSGVNPICKTCKKMSVYRNGDPEKPLMKDFLWGNEVVTFKKFKYRDYCSDECKRKAHNKRRRKEKEKRICPYCHAKYEGRGKTCKKPACRKQAYRKMKKRDIIQLR